MTRLDFSLFSRPEHVRMKLGVNIQVNFAWFPLNSNTARPAPRARPHAGDLWSDAGACALCLLRLFSHRNPFESQLALSSAA